jgi:hypothetical protein
MTILIGIDDQVIEATPEMEEKIKADQAAYLANEKRLADEKAVKDLAKADLLARLGITEDEAKLLLG